MIAALRALRPLNPARLIAAMAVAPPSAVDRIRAEADELVCLEIPSDFYAVGQFFGDFHQVSDEEVTEILARSNKRTCQAR
jgi:predicted phosphoribosyltransferase